MAALGPGPAVAAVDHPGPGQPPAQSSQTRPSRRKVAGTHISPADSGSWAGSQVQSRPSLTPNLEAAPTGVRQG